MLVHVDSVETHRIAMSITTNKVQSAITNYITIENTSENNTGTNKKRKTISG